MVKTPKSGGISQNTVMALIAVSLLLVALSTFWQLWAGKTKEKFESPKLTVNLIYASWCGHCEKYLASGKWEQVSAVISKEYSGVVFEKHDFDKTPKDKTEKYNVNAFPTIAAEDKNGRIYTFLGDRANVVHMELFVKNALDGKDTDRSAY